MAVLSAKGLGMTHTLKIHGHVPTKKNGKHAWRGKVVIDPAIKAQIEALQWRVRAVWGARGPLPSACISMRFYVRDGRSDGDGKYSTMQDVLVKAGVLRNDSIARVPAARWSTRYDEKEHTEIRLREVA